MKTFETIQSTITIQDDRVVKAYKNNKDNKMSSISNEIAAIERFGKSFHCPKILRTYDNTYEMERYGFDLGYVYGINECSVRKLLMYISFDDLERQLSDIIADLHSCRIQHRDIHPGNLVFSKKDNNIKVLDFYWAIIDNNEPEETPSSLNSVYGLNDENAMNRIITEVSGISNIVKNEVNGIILKTGVMGTKGYYDGSSLSKGLTYHKIPIHHFDKVPYHKKVEDDFEEVIKHITDKPSVVTEIGSAGGFYTFNFLKMFDIHKIVGYEADPIMFDILSDIKTTFCLNEIEFLSGINKSSEVQKSDLTLCMNVHMWLDKQFGREGSSEIMRTLMNNTKWLFFQTASKDSSSMHIVNWLESKGDVARHLYEVGAKNVTFIRTTHKHGKNRHLFLCKGGSM
jgi:serine/threonine protein kinase